jgi:hypothetical protein
VAVNPDTGLPEPFGLRTPANGDRSTSFSSSKYGRSSRGTQGLLATVAGALPCIPFTKSWIVLVGVEG